MNDISLQRGSNAPQRAIDDILDKGARMRRKRKTPRSASQRLMDNTELCRPAGCFTFCYIVARPHEQTRGRMYEKQSWGKRQAKARSTREPPVTALHTNNYRELRPTMPSEWSGSTNVTGTRRASLARKAKSSIGFGLRVSRAAAPPWP